MIEVWDNRRLNRDCSCHNWIRDLIQFRISEKACFLKEQRFRPNFKKCTGVSQVRNAGKGRVVPGKGKTTSSIRNAVECGMAEE